ncbi:MAG: hypothetical protein IKN18_00570 [Neisseriaceae bacterium]|nr:hypothetical protein [Neisseriaceae bacterium]
MISVIASEAARRSVAIFTLWRVNLIFRLFIDGVSLSKCGDCHALTLLMLAMTVRLSFRLPESLLYVVRRLPRRFTARNDGSFFRVLL